MNPTEPVPVEGNREDIAAALDGGDTLFVGLDFDGTLTPIDEDPNAPQVTRACRAALEDLVAIPAVTVAVVSGRALSDLRPRVDVDGVRYVGNHGLEAEVEGSKVVHPGARDRRPALRDAVTTLEERFEDVPGCVVEDKDLTATVHCREVPPERVEEVREVLEAVVTGAGDDLELTRGKAVLELRPAVDWDKGAAVRAGAERLDGTPRLLYVGDDVTDEDAFRDAGDDGIGVLVGDRRETRADYRLGDQGEVAPFLSWLAAVARQ